MWNKFVNTSGNKLEGPGVKEVKAAAALDLEEQLDALDVDFVSLSTQIADKEVCVNMNNCVN